MKVYIVNQDGEQLVQFECFGFITTPDESDGTNGTTVHRGVLTIIVDQDPLKTSRPTDAVMIHTSDAATGSEGTT